MVGTFHEFHHNGALLDSLNRGNIGMVDRSEHLRLALEAGHAVGICGECIEENLERERAIQLGVRGLVDGAPMPPSLSLEVIR